MANDQIVELVLKDLTYQIISAIYEVHNVLGYGFLENVYEKALLREFQLNGIKAEAQKEVKVIYKGQEIGSYFPDILVNDQIVLELKAVENLNKFHEAQVLNYLKGTGLKLGLLVNFGKDRAEYKRLIL